MTNDTNCSPEEAAARALEAIMLAAPRELRRQIDEMVAELRAREPQGGDNDLRVLHEVFGLCEATETEMEGQTDPFKRGRAFEAKGIRRAIGNWFQSEFCGSTRMGEPVLKSKPQGEPVAKVRRSHFGGRGRNIGTQEVDLLPGAQLMDGASLFTHPDPRVAVYRRLLERVQYEVERTLTPELAEDIRTALGEGKS